MDKGQVFVLAIIAITMIGGILKMSIRAKHGLAPDVSYRGERHRGRLAQRHGIDATDDLEAQRKIELLAAENERLTGQLGRLEERLRVLERIATDPAERTAREIDALR